MPGVKKMPGGRYANRSFPLSDESPGLSGKYYRTNHARFIVEFLPELHFTHEKGVESHFKKLFLQNESALSQRSFIGSRVTVTPEWLEVVILERVSRSSEQTEEEVSQGGEAEHSGYSGWGGLDSNFLGILSFTGNSENDLRLDSEADKIIEFETLFTLISGFSEV